MEGQKDDRMNGGTEESGGKEGTFKSKGKRIK